MFGVPDGVVESQVANATWIRSQHRDEKSALQTTATVVANNADASGIGHCLRNEINLAVLATINSQNMATAPILQIHSMMEDPEAVKSHLQHHGSYKDFMCRPSTLYAHMSTRRPPSIDSTHEELIPLRPKQGQSSTHYDDTRKESRVKVGFLVAAPIIAYISLAITTTVVLIYAIHSHRFHISSTDKLFGLEDGRITFLPFSGLRQSDVTTLVSLASTLTRFFGSICCGIACWQAAYILLEKEGLSLADLDGLVSLPFLRPWPWSTYRIVLSCVALLFLSSELYSPILNGSISWETVTSIGPKGDVLKGISQSWSSWMWRIPRRDYSVVVRAVILVMTGLVNARQVYDTSHTSDLWRVVDVARDLPINSTLANITLPFFVIDSFEWINDPDNTLDPTILNVTESGSGLLNYTSSVNPMDDSPYAGTLALIPKTGVNTTTIDVLQPTTVTGSYYVVMNMGISLRGQTCEQQTGQWYDDVPVDLKYHARYLGYTNSGGIIGKYFYCLAFARVFLRAGVGQCTNCQITSRFTLRNETEMELLEDIMTEPAFHVMPEVSIMLGLANRTLLAPQMGLDRYIIDTLTQAYCGTWNALTDVNNWVGQPLETEVRISVLLSAATVDQRRVVAWLALNMCVAACCAAIVFVQASTGKRRVLVDATLAAVLLDATEVVDGLRKGDQGEEEEGRGGREEDASTTGRG
ncbi:hypothetical protein FRC17_004136 [Serendipita sp. 399]|nr:hypothetical protein FRC17_004136 [Serendipita sp. 399]